MMKDQVRREVGRGGFGCRGLGRIGWICSHGSGGGCTLEWPFWIEQEWSGEMVDDLKKDLVSLSQGKLAIIAAFRF